jgi:hypothetical protein
MRVVSVGIDAFGPHEKDFKRIVDGVAQVLEDFEIFSFAMAT